MTSSLKRKSLSKPISGNVVPTYDLALVRGRNKNKAHSLLLEQFRDSGLSKAEVAQMLNRRPEQITRWLAGPGNLTLETLSDLVFALSGNFIKLQLSDDLAKAKSNHCQSEWWVKKSDNPKWVPSGSQVTSEYRESPKIFSSNSNSSLSTATKKGSGYEKIAS